MKKLFLFLLFLPASAFAQNTGGRVHVPSDMPAASGADYVVVSNGSGALWVNLSNCHNGASSKLLYTDVADGGPSFTCGTDQTNTGGSGILSLNGDVTVSQTTVDGAADANVLLAITNNSAGTNTWTITWAGTLAKARTLGTTVYTDQANTWGNFAEKFQAGTNFSLLDKADQTKIGQFDLSNIAAGNTRTVTWPNAASTFMQPITCTNQVISIISSVGLATCHTIALATDVSGQLPIGNVGSSGLSGTSPVTISAAGAIGCATCNTSSATVSSVTIAGTAGQIFAGGTCTITTTGTCTLEIPSVLILGTDNSAPGLLRVANDLANAHTLWGSGATTTNQINGFATVPVTGHLVDCTVSTTTCLLHDSGVVTANVVNASSPGLGLAHFAGSTQTVTSGPVTSADATGNTSGSGNFCLVTNCAMTTPNLGTPSAVALTNATLIPLGQTTGTLKTTANPNGIHDFSTSSLTPGGSAGVYNYVAPTKLAMPASYTTAIGAGTTMRWHIRMSKTAAGTGAFNIRGLYGTNGSTSDTTLFTQSVGTATAALDDMDVDVLLSFTSATAAYWSVSCLHSAASAAGFGCAIGSEATSGTLSGLTTTTASLIFGIAYSNTTGTAVITVPLVEAEAFGVN